MASALAGCSTSPMSRVDANRAEYESWPFEIQQAVLAGRAAVGMTPEMVRVSLGEPNEIETRPRKGGDEEVWIYKKGGGRGNLLKRTNISLSVGGIGLGGNPLGSGMGSGNAVEERHEVIFQNGVVVRERHL
ncbi:MAG: hypothetical protein EXS39_02680 [Opitutaceae bacterium]|nr:hypothetical protein [Opitutaceae bacterium]